MTDDMGATPSGSGLSPTVEPASCLDGSATSIPSAGARRELWRSGPHEYPDIVFVTADGELGLKADFGRPVTMRIGEWHYLPEKVRRLSAGYKAFPRDVASVLDELCDPDCCYSAKAASEKLGLSEARVRDIRRALKVLGLAQCGPLMTEEGAVAGQGYWRSLAGDKLADALYTAQGIVTATADETRSGSVERSEIEPGPKDAPNG